MIRTFLEKNDFQLFGVNLGTILFSLGCAVYIHFLFSRRPIPYDMTYEEAEHQLSLMRPETLWEQIEEVLDLYLTNLGFSMAGGHTWHELAVQLHGESRDCFFLLTIIADITQNGIHGEWAIAAIRIIHGWEFPSSSLGRRSPRVSSLPGMPAIGFGVDNLFWGTGAGELRSNIVGLPRGLLLNRANSLMGSRAIHFSGLTSLNSLFPFLCLGYFFWGGLEGNNLVLESASHFFNDPGSHQVLSVAGQVATLTPDSGGILAVDEVCLPEEDQRSLEEQGRHQVACSIEVMIGTLVLCVMLNNAALLATYYSVGLTE